MESVLENEIWLLAAVLLLTLIGVGVNYGLYELGREGRSAIEERFPQIKPAQWQRVQDLYQRFGAWALLLSGLPLIGPLIATAAGVFRIRPLTFLILILVSQLVRNTLIVLAAVGTYSLITG